MMSLDIFKDEYKKYQKADSLIRYNGCHTAEALST
jgi:hypothetical protein